MPDDHKIDDCPQAPVLSEIQKKQAAQDKKIDAILATLERQTETFNKSIQELTTVLISNARQGEVLLQLKKENDLIFASQREVKKDIQDIKERNAKCDGAGIFENFPTIWNWYQAHKRSDVDFDKMWKWYIAEQGWRRTIPALVGLSAVVLSIYVILWGPIYSEPKVATHTHQEVG